MAEGRRRGHAPIYFLIVIRPHLIVGRESSWARPQPEHGLVLHAPTRAPSTMPAILGQSARRGTPALGWCWRLPCGGTYQLRAAVEVGGGPIHPWSGECDSTGGRTGEGHMHWHMCAPTLSRLEDATAAEQFILCRRSELLPSSGRLGRRTWPQSALLLLHDG